MPTTRVRNKRLESSVGRKRTGDVADVMGASEALSGKLSRAMADAMDASDEFACDSEETVTQPSSRKRKYAPPI